jgi:yecA family protein
VVENQVAMNKPPSTRATLERLLSGGVDRMTAIRVMSEVMADALARAISGDQGSDSDDFEQALQQLDPARILASQSDEDAPPNALHGVPDFNDTHRQVLIEFSRRHADEEAMSWPETAGFLFAVQACPDLIMPSEWTEIIQGQAVFNDLEEAQAVTEARTALMNWVSDCIHQGQPAIPVDCKPGPDPLRILEADNNFSRWCRGVTEGHHWLEQSWEQALTIDSDDDRALNMAWILFAFFTDRSMAERTIEELAGNSLQDAATLEELAWKFHDLVEQAAVDYADVGLTYRQTHSAPPAQQPVRSRKIGRNEPCPCGSGVKYKKCCGRPGAGRPH